jgi:ABC-type transporter Mla subunit MlaD
VMTLSTSRVGLAFIALTPPDSPPPALGDSQRRNA